MNILYVYKNKSRFTKCYWGDKNQGEMGGPCNTQVEDTCLQNNRKGLKGRDHSEE